MNLLVKIFLSLLFLLGVLGVVGTAVLMVRDTNKMPTRPDHATDALIAELPVQGRMSIGVVRYHNRLLTRHTGGAAEHELYPMGDLIQMFISVGIQQQFDQGRLDFNDKLGKFLSDLPAPLAELTIFQLLTHTGGLPQNVLLADLDTTTLQPPGKESVWSPAGYQLLERVLVTVSEQDFNAYVAKEIIERLNNAIRDYSGKKDYLEGAQLEHTAWREAEGDRDAGWYTCLEDMVLYEDAMNSNMLVKMKTDQKAFTSPWLGPETRGDYGFGWSIADFRGFRMEQALSKRPGANHAMTRFSERNYAAIILSDLPVDRVNTGFLGREIGEIYLQREMPLQPDESERVKF